MATTVKTKSTVTTNDTHPLQRHLEICDYLLKRGADIDVTTHDDDNPLLIAAQNGDIEIVEFLLERGANVNITNKLGLTALHFAALQGYPQIARVLIDAGAGMESGPLIFASGLSRGGVLRELLEAGGDVNTRSQIGTNMSLIQKAARDGIVDLVQYLLENGANVEDVDDEGSRAIHLATLNNHLEVVKYLSLNGGANVEAVQNVSGQRPLHMACKAGYLDIVKFLISEAGANAEIRTINEWNPLHFAVAYNRLEVVEYLIDEVGVDLEAKGHEGMSPLHLACKGGFLALVEILLKKGANKEARTLMGYTPLIVSVAHSKYDSHEKNRYLHVVRYLVEFAGVNAEGKDQYGYQALHFASEHNQLEIVQYLIESAGVNWEVQNISNVRPIHLASLFGHLDIVKYLVSLGAEVNVVAKDGATPLSVAALGGHLNLVKFLIANGAKIS